MADNGGNVMAFFFIVIYVVITVPPWWRIINRTGLSPFFILFALIPLASYVLLYLVAYLSWPDLEAKTHDAKPRPKGFADS